MTWRIPSIAVVSATLIFLPALPQARQATPQQQQEQPSEQMKPQGDMAPKCQAMMARHEKMMTELKAADQRLDDLVARMTAATGQAKVDATAAVVAEMVRQRKSMRDGMMTMQHGMMEHMAEHMQAGPGSMTACPMMKMKGMGDMMKKN